MKNLAFVILLGACSSSAVEIATVDVGGQSFLVSREGAVPAAGGSMVLIVKATTGAKPDAVSGWIGKEEDDETKVPGVYDPADGDFDIDVTAPSPLPADAKYYFEVEANGTVKTGSADLK